LPCVHRLFCCRSKVRNLYLHGGLLLTSPYDEFVMNSGGITPSTQPHNTSINTTEQTPLLEDTHTPIQNITESTQGPSGRQIELLDPSGYATFSGKSSREQYSVKKDVTV